MATVTFWQAFVIRLLMVNVFIINLLSKKVNRNRHIIQWSGDVLFLVQLENYSLIFFFSRDILFSLILLLLKDFATRKHNLYFACN